MNYSSARSPFRPTCRTATPELGLVGPESPVRLALPGVRVAGRAGGGAGAGGGHGLWARRLWGVRRPARSGLSRGAGRSVTPPPPAAPPPGPRPRPPPPPPPPTRR